MITKSIDVMLSNPGIWVVIGTDMGVTAVFLVEVEPGGACHQLDPRTLERDGPLGAGSWNIGQVASFTGPLARKE